MVINLLAKFDVSSSNRSRDMEGVQNFKSRSRDPFLAHFGPILHFFRRLPSWWICMQNLAFLALALLEIWRGSHNFKIRSRDPFPTCKWGSSVTRYLDSSIPICLFTIQFYLATMTIQGSLLASILNVKAFLAGFWSKI